MHSMLPFFDLTNIITMFLREFVLRENHGICSHSVHFCKTNITVSDVFHFQITVDIPEHIGEVEMNRPKSVQLEIYIPKGRTIDNSSLLIICPKSEESDKPQCTLKVLRRSNGKQIGIGHTSISNITEFNKVQHNRVQINFTNIRSAGEDETRDANMIHLEIELRATHCMELENQKTITIQFESRFDEQLISKNATINVHHKGQPITDLDLKMYINTSDVYPG
ncbi:hypothetical protein D915_010682 [Fasciola hepatica]|uniref:Uncharacterized protein n=1 Tax=Fasciola hepatica TaxID=6192 RepID=A0A4E0QUE5_FASHE|nr:hypothetical protein D915_010682 [Fasciola hepatica]